MRNIVTALAAFAASVLVAGLAAVLLAQELRAQEEFILVFAAVVPLGMIFVLRLLAASYRREPRGAISRVARWLLAVVVLLVAGLAGYAFYVAQMRIGVVGDLPMLLGISIPAAIVLLVQWTVFAFRARPAAPPPMQFGRNGAQ